ncbi:MAG: TolC family protein [Calditrichaeota bacterium]|nr:TolC family protein [Calditrichota bacterium]MCB9089119.1 TolC family protein [Calditrichia bacterium]
MKLKWHVITFFILLISFNAWGQEGPTPISLQECIRIAFERNADVQISRNAAQIAGHNYTASYSSVLPRVNTNYSATNFRSGDATTQQDVPVFDSTNTVVGFVNQEVTNPGFERNSYRASLDVGLDLFDGGAMWNNIRKSKADKNAAYHSLNVQIDQTITAVAENYLNLLKQEKLLEVNTLAVQRSQDNLDRSEKMFEIGSVAKVDVFRARVNLGNDRISLISQRNTVHQAKQTLNVAMGREPNTPLEISKDVNFDYQLPPLESLLNSAMDQQPEIKRREMELRSRELNVSLSKSSFLPSLSAFFSYGRSNSVFDKIYSDVNQNWSVTVGVQGSFNLFNGFQDMVNHQNAKLNVKSTQIDLEAYKRTLVSNISTTYQRYKDLLEIIEINKENLEAAKEEYRLATERYRLGSGTSLDVREAQVNLTDAERILVAAEYDLIITYAQLQEAVGDIQQALNL